MSGNSVILLDTSGSMAIPEGTRARIHILRDILQQVLTEIPTAKVIAFASLPLELVGLEPGGNFALPEPGGSTAMHRALGLVARQTPRPDRIVVISDGMPDDPQAAISAARALAPVVIDALYAGSDGDKAAIGFMRTLSLAGGTGRGIAGARSLARPESLAKEITRLLSGPTR